MAGETVKSEAICLKIYPFSRTSHVVQWMTSSGKLTTLVKGAVRPKSMFLGQYDLNYTCEIVYYVRSKGDIHVLREAYPLDLREALRGDYRALVLADYFRSQVAEYAPSGADAKAWYELLKASIGGRDLKALVTFDIRMLELLGLKPEIASEGGKIALRGERMLPVSAEVAECMRDPEKENNYQILLDTERVISVFYQFHMDGEAESRRSVLRIISKT